LWLARVTPLYHAVGAMRAATSLSFDLEAMASLLYLIVVGGLLALLATNGLERRLMK
jgi:hypothetical protein